MTSDNIIKPLLTDNDYNHKNYATHSNHNISSLSSSSSISHNNQINNEIKKSVNERIIKKYVYEVWFSFSRPHCCYGYCFLGPITDTCPLFTGWTLVLLIGVLYYLSVGVYLYKHSFYLFIVESVIYVLLIIFYLRSCFRDPGVILPLWLHQAVYRAKGESYLNECDQLVERVSHPSKYNVNIITNSDVTNPKLDSNHNNHQHKRPLYIPHLTSESKEWAEKTCETCNIPRPPLSSHCSHCNQCVAEFDHHCNWIMNCVGQRNHRDFIGFLTCVTICSWLFLFTSIYVAVFEDITDHYNPMIIPVIILTSILTCFITPTWYYHLFDLALCSGQTLKQRHNEGKLDYSCKEFLRNCWLLCTYNAAPSIVNLRTKVLLREEVNV